MSDLTIFLDDNLEKRLRERASQNGRSMEAAARQILSDALSERQPTEKLGQAIRRRFAPLGGVDLPPYERGPVRDPPTFD